MVRCRACRGLTARETLYITSEIEKLSKLRRRLLCINGSLVRTFNVFGWLGWFSTAGVPPETRRHNPVLQDYEWTCRLLRLEINDLFTQYIGKHERSPSECSTRPNSQSYKSFFQRTADNLNSLSSFSRTVSMKHGNRNGTNQNRPHLQTSAYHFVRNELI